MWLLVTRMCVCPLKHLFEGICKTPHVVIPLARRDSWNSLAGEVYATACRLANADQREKLDEEIRRLNIRSERWW